MLLCSLDLRHVAKRAMETTLGRVGGFTIQWLLHVGYLPSVAFVKCGGEMTFHVF